MNNKHILLVFLLLALVTGACGFNVDFAENQGSGNVETESRDVSGFNRVQLNGIGDVILTQGDKEELIIEAEDNILDRITTEVRDDTLYIGFDRRVILPTKPIKYYLTMRDVRGLETKGVSNLKSESIDTDQLDVGISGTGNIDIQSLNADSLDVHISGAGSFDAEGEVSDQQVNLSGAGNYSAEDLMSRNADVSISGLGKVVVWATDNLDVTISGAGDVDYYGSPQVTQRISGIGGLNHNGDK